MRNLLTRLLILFTLPLAALAEDLTVRATANRSKIYWGETFNLTIEVSGADRDLLQPALAIDKAAATTEYLGSQSQSRSSITVVNGKVTRDVRQGRAFTYRIKPAQAGTFDVGTIRVATPTAQTQTPGPAIEVTGLQAQSNVLAQITVTSTEVLVDERIRLTLTLDLQALNGKYAQVEPILPDQPPTLTADFLEIAYAPDGLKTPDLQTYLNQHVQQNGTRAPAFYLNDYKTQGFSSFFDFGDPFQGRPIRFRIDPEKTDIDARRYYRYKIELDYTPTQLGSYTFGPLTFKGPVVTGVTEQGRPTLTDIFTIAPAVTVRVIPPPEENRPATFVGAVGRDMRATAELDTATCKVGDPLNLTLTLTGDVNTTGITAPDLSTLPIKPHFRLYEESLKTKTHPNGRSFTYRIRPLQPGTLEFPPIPVSYFNTATRAYQTIATDPIPLQVQATTQIAADAQDTLTLTQNGIKALPAAITHTPGPGMTAPHISRLQLLLPLNLLPITYYLLLTLLPPLLYLLTRLIPALRRKITTHLQHTQPRRQAAAAARAIRRAKTPEQLRAAITRRLAHPITLTPEQTTRLNNILYSGQNTDITTLRQQIANIPFQPQ